MPSMSYFFSSASYKKEDFDDADFNDYKPYVMNRMVAQYRDLVMFAEEMNRATNLTNEEQYLFYKLLIPKKKRRTLWPSKRKNEDLEVIMEYYGVSRMKAEDYLKILNDDQISNIKSILNAGRK